MFEVPLLPDEEVLLSLHPAQLAEPLLVYFRWQVLQFHPNGISQGNFFRQQVENRGRASAQAISEAWSWLAHQGLIVERAQNPELGVFVGSRAGASLVLPEHFEEYRVAALMPRALLHPIVADRAWPNFLRGDYDTAVFAAFKSVEIAVARKSGCLGTGVQLMRAAFHKTSGPLRDETLHEAEREGMGQLFAGAFATLRNPTGHRDVTYSDPKEPAEQLVIASHLMRVVEASPVSRN